MTLCSIFVICYSGIAAICAMYTAYNLLLTLRVHWSEAGARAFGCLVVACLAMPAHFAMPARQRLVVVPCHACAPVLLLLDVHRRGAGSGFPVVYCEYFAVVHVRADALLDELPLVGGVCASVCQRLCATTTVALVNKCHAPLQALCMCHYII